MIDMAQVQGQVHAQSIQTRRRARRAQPARDRRDHAAVAARRTRLIRHGRTRQSHERNDEIADLVATLAGRQQQRTTIARPLNGPERAAVLMLALGE